jgi:hypothetical protein
MSFVGMLADFSYKWLVPTRNPQFRVLPKDARHRRLCGGQAKPTEKMQHRGAVSQLVSDEPPIL